MKETNISPAAREYSLCGKRLAELRCAKKKTQAQVAAETGISISAIQKYEHGIRRPSDKHKITLARYYGQKVAELFYSDFSCDSDVNVL